MKKASHKKTIINIANDKLIDEMQCFLCGYEIQWYQHFVLYDKNCVTCRHLVKGPFLETDEERKKHAKDYIELSKTHDLVHPAIVKRIRHILDISSLLEQAGEK